MRDLRVRTLNEDQLPLGTALPHVSHVTVFFFFHVVFTHMKLAGRQYFADNGEIIKEMSETFNKDALFPGVITQVPVTYMLSQQLPKLLTIVYGSHYLDSNNIYCIMQLKKKSLNESVKYDYLFKKRIKNSYFLKGRE